ncbi:MAG: 2OG-Fe dioxygenase family protein [Burkholderiales bacterium]|nr:2OG-Fe dioxygenase family protein [Burkholderiales bacterium]
MHSLNPTPLDQTTAALRTDGWSVIAAPDMVTWLGATEPELAWLQSTWNDLPADTHLRDGGHYRFRRHSCFLVEPATAHVTQVPHRAHWQPVIYNALHGGIERWFEPITPDVAQHRVWQALLGHLGQLLAQVKPVERWFVEAHQFRVDTTGGIGRPTPEGAHRDGVDFVAVIMLGRQGIKGGESRVFEADGPNGVRFTLQEPWSTLLLDDERVIHESTPIQPLGQHGWRDTLVLTYRAGGFQGPSST